MEENMSGARRAPQTEMDGEIRRDYLYGNVPRVCDRPSQQWRLPRRRKPIIVPSNINRAKVLARLAWFENVGPILDDRLK